MSDFEIVSHRTEIERATETAVERILVQWGLVAEGHAVKYVHVITSRLKNSITHQVDTEAGEVAIGTNVEYARYEELGTSTRPEHPYLRPAITRHIDEYKLIAENELKS